MEYIYAPLVVSLSTDPKPPSPSLPPNKPPPKLKTNSFCRWRCWPRWATRTSTCTLSGCVSHYTCACMHACALHQSSGLGPYTTRHTTHAHTTHSSLPSHPTSFIPLIPTQPNHTTLPTPHTQPQLGTYLAELAPHPIPKSQAFAVTCVAQVCFILTNPLWGAVGDRLGGAFLRFWRLVACVACMYAVVHSVAWHCVRIFPVPCPPPPQLNTPCQQTTNTGAQQRLRWNLAGVVLGCILPPLLFKLVQPGQMPLDFGYAAAAGLLMVRFVSMSVLVGWLDGNRVQCNSCVSIYHAHPLNQPSLNH